MKAVNKTENGRSLSRSLIRENFDESARVVRASAEALEGPLEQAARFCLDCLAGDGTILACGNGGSAADAQHFVAELVCRLKHDRAAQRAVALSVDTSVLTSIANDLGFEHVFARQVEALARSGDLLIAISTSGTSPNVVAAARAARTRGCRVVALTGETGGSLAELADVLLAVPSTVVSRIQEIHSICIHILAETIENAVLERSIAETQN